MADNEEAMISTPSDFGPFRLEKELGHGGMGGVYLARDKMLDRQVAIKVMLKSLGDDPMFVERFKKEAQAAAKLVHPNIAQIYRFDIEQGRPYIAMELVSGGSLEAEMTKNKGTMSVVRIMKLAEQLAEALSIAAEGGLVHGDVKPENVLYDNEGNAKLVDFGLAAMQADTNEIWGTPYYISPEKVKRQKVDFRADIYSLGGTLYHALTGVPPFDGADANEVVKARFAGPAKKPSEIRADVPPEVDAILMRMLEEEPARRYPTYESLLGDIKRYLTKAGPASSGGTAGKLRSGKKIMIKGRRPRPAAATSEDGAVDANASAPSPAPAFGLDPALAGGIQPKKKEKSIGAMIGMTIGGIVVALALIGGILGYVVHSNTVEKQEQRAKDAETALSQGQTAIKGTMDRAREFAEQLNAICTNTEKTVNNATAELRRALTPEAVEAYGDRIVPPHTQDYEDAVVFVKKLAEDRAAAKAKADAALLEAQKPAAAPADTNKVAEAEGKAAEAKAASTNATAAAAEKKPVAKAVDPDKEAEEALAAAEAKAEGKNKEEIKAEGDAEAKDDGEAKAKDEEAEKPAEEEKPAEVELPSSIKQFQTLWADVDICRAANMCVSEQIRYLIEDGEEFLNGANQEIAQIRGTVQNVDDRSDRLGAVARKLADYSRKILDSFEEIKAQKIVDTAQRKAGSVKQKAPALIRGVNNEMNRIRRNAEKKAAAEAEKKAKEEAAAKKVEEERILSEEEVQKANAKYEEMLNLIKHLLWDVAEKNIKAATSEFKTHAGKEAAATALKKVVIMHDLQQHFIKFAKGLDVKNRVKVDAVSPKSITFQRYNIKGNKDGKEETVEWSSFYRKPEFRGRFNRMIIELVEKGRETTKLPPLKWSNLMYGAALTMQTFFSDDPNVPNRIEQIVKTAAKKFPDNAKTATKIFPDIQLEAAEE